MRVCPGPKSAERTTGVSGEEVHLQSRRGEVQARISVLRIKDIKVMSDNRLVA